MKIKYLLSSLLLLSVLACKHQPKETNTTKTEEATQPTIEQSKVERKNLLTPTETANLMIWMRKKPDIIHLYNNKGNDGAEGLTSNVDFKKRLMNYHKVEVGDIRLMDYEENEGTQTWTYRIIKFIGDDTKVYVGKAGFKGKAFIPGEKVFDWVRTSQLNPS